MESDQLSPSQSDEEEDPCSNFSDNEAIESDEEFEMAIQTEQEKRPAFEELIGYTQEDDYLMNGNSKKARLDDHSPMTSQPSKKRRNRSGTKGNLKTGPAEDQDAVMSTFSDK